MFDFDKRNGWPHWENLFLCGNTLTYLWKFRDFPELKLSGWVLNENDRLMGKFNNLQSWYPKENVWKIEKVQPRVLHQRWLCCTAKEAQQNVCIDLKSIRSADERNVMYDTLAIPSAMDPAKAILSLTNVPSYEMTTRNGYPVRCIKCGTKTESGTMSMPSSLHYTLGAAVCGHYLIRYSVSKKAWECMNVVLDDEDEVQQCCATVGGPDYICTNASHMDAKDVSINIQAVKKRKLHPETQAILCVNVSTKASQQTTHSAANPLSFF